MKLAYAAHVLNPLLGTYNNTAHFDLKLNLH